MGPAAGAGDSVPRDPGFRPARIFGGAACRLAGIAAGEMEDRDPDGRDRGPDRRQRRSGVSAGRGDRRDPAVGGRAADPGDRLRLSPRRPRPYDPRAAAGPWEIAASRLIPCPTTPLTRRLRRELLPPK